MQGNRELIDSMAGGSAKVLTQVLKLIDNHDLYGSVAYPKRHTQKDISDIYRLSLATHGVFTNVALQEPFGLTVIEVRSPCQRSHIKLPCTPAVMSGATSHFAWMHHMSGSSRRSCSVTMFCCCSWMCSACTLLEDIPLRDTGPQSFFQVTACSAVLYLTPNLGMHTSHHRLRLRNSFFAADHKRGVMITRSSYLACALQQATMTSCLRHGNRHMCEFYCQPVVGTCRLRRMACPPWPPRMGVQWTS